MQTALKNLVTEVATYDHADTRAYDYAYQDAMERINGQLKGQEELAKQVLLWITFVERPLAIEELQHAIAVVVGESQLDELNISDIEDMISVCAGLVTVDEESRIIRLVHYTTQEYFERTREQWFPNAQTDISTICVTYLSFTVFKSGPCQNDEDFEQRLRSNELYDYAAKNWGHHTRKASVSSKEVINFLERKAQFDASIQGLLAEKQYSSGTWHSQSFPKDVTGLHLAALFGIKDIVIMLLENQANIEAKDGRGQTPLHRASEHGHIEVVKLLLERGADPAVADSTGWTPLYEASESGHIEVVKLLLERGPDPAVADSEGRTPLHRASEDGHEEVVKLLLERGADPVVARGGPIVRAGHHYMRPLGVGRSRSSSSCSRGGPIRQQLIVRAGHHYMRPLGVGRSRSSSSYLRGGPIR